MKNLILIFCLFLNEVSAQVIINPLSIGAKGDGVNFDTKYIQKAIDSVNKMGGGTVILPSGKSFLCGSIFLKSNVHLILQGNSIIIGSPNKKDYAFITRPLFHYKRLENHPLKFKRQHLINIMDVENVTISGTGTIFGNGKKFWEPFDSTMLPKWIKADLDRVSNLVEVHRSKNINFRDFTMKESPEWTMHIFDSDHVKVEGITIDNGLFGPNNDGIDINSSRNVFVSNCDITTCDDAICVKSSHRGGVTENVLVTNCKIQTSCVGLKIGNETAQDIKYVTFSNCIIQKSSRPIGIYGEEGGVIENIQFNNIISNTNAPLVLNRPIHISQHTSSEKDMSGFEFKPSKIRNIFINDFKCETDGRIIITAESKGGIENLYLNNIILNYAQILDPYFIADSAKSGQFMQLNTDDKKSRSALVINNVVNFNVENLQINWPKNQIAKSWIQYPIKIENGSLKKHLIKNFPLKEVDFSVMRATNTTGNILISLNIQSSDPKKIKPFLLINSDIKIKKY